MQITDCLIRRFLSGEDCSSEEVDRVSRYLVDNPEILKEYLESDWEGADNIMPLPSDQSADMLHQISGQVFGRSARIRHIGRYGIGWAAAAILILIAGIGLLRLHQRSGNSGAGLVAKAVSLPLTPKDSWKTQMNNTKFPKRVLLPDGSVVSLFAQGCIRYKEPFINSNREISLKGQAHFDVVKDAAHPFVVKAGNTVTTVLGTSFNVLENENGVTVKLYNGKVSVRATDKDFILSPGEQMKYQADNGLVSVAAIREGSAADAGEAAARAAAMVNIGTLVFANTALPEVMEKLSRRYHVPIQYDHSAIGKMYFTGSVFGTDSLSTILRAIANMNDLSIVSGNNGFKITASPK